MTDTEEKELRDHFARVRKMATHQTDRGWNGVRLMGSIALLIALTIVFAVPGVPAMAFIGIFWAGVTIGMEMRRMMALRLMDEQAAFLDNVGKHVLEVTIKQARERRCET